MEITYGLVTIVFKSGTKVILTSEEFEELRKEFEKTSFVPYEKYPLYPVYPSYPNTPFPWITWKDNTGNQPIPPYTTICKEE